MTDEHKLLTEEDCRKLALHLGISQRMAEVLVRMYNSPVLTHEEIAADHLTKRPGTTIMRLRAALFGQGVEIYTKSGMGYWIDNTGRANVGRLLTIADTRLVPSAGGEHNV